MGSVVWVLEQISYTFQQCKNCDNRLRFDKVTESLMMGTFLRHSVVFFYRSVYFYTWLIGVGRRVVHLHKHCCNSPIDPLFQAERPVNSFLAEAGDVKSRNSRRIRKSHRADLWFLHVACMLWCRHQIGVKCEEFYARNRCRFFTCLSLV